MRYIGKSFPIHDAEAKVSGKARYAADMNLPGQLYLALIFSSIPHGYVKAFDLREAEKMEKVVDIFHALNSPDRKFCRYRTLYGQETVNQECLFNRHVRFVGDRIGAVVAKDLKTAQLAAEKVKVIYEPLPFALHVEEAMRGDNASIFDAGAIFGEFDEQYGEAVEDENTLVEVESFTSLSRLTHCAMENHACLADYDSGSGVLGIYSPNQDVHGLRTVLADLFSLPYHSVRVIKTTMGGSFGCKQEWMLEPIAAYAALKLQRPVLFPFNRRDTIRSTICRGPMKASANSSFSSAGILKKLKLEVILDAGAYVTNSIDYLRAMSSKLFRTYRYEEARMHAQAVCTNTPVSGAYRGWSAPELCTILEHNLNMAARELRMDPLELRLKNIAIEHDVDVKLNLTLGEIHTRLCLEKGRQHFQWDKKRKEDAVFNSRNQRWRRGTAVACGGHVSSYYPRFPDFGTAKLAMNEDGSILGRLSLHDHGCGTVQAMTMIVAETLDVPLETVRITEADSQNTPFDYGCFSSRSTYVIGRAAQECALALKQLLVEETAKSNHLPANSLYVKNGQIYSTCLPSFASSYAEAARLALFVSCRQPEATVDFRSLSNPGVTGSHFAHVEVDLFSGKCKILDYLAVHDIGQAINREMCIAQIQGAVLMGAGAALSEQVLINEDGNCRASFKNYHVINAPDAPNIDVILVEQGKTDGPFGAKSIGEVCHVPVAAAVVGAVNEALGTDLSTLPLTPDLILETLEKVGKSKGQGSKK